MSLVLVSIVIYDHIAFNRLSTGWLNTPEVRQRGVHNSSQDLTEEMNGRLAKLSNGRCDKPSMIENYDNWVYLVDFQVSSAPPWVVNYDRKLVERLDNDLNSEKQVKYKTIFC